MVALDLHLFPHLTRRPCFVQLRHCVPVVSSMPKNAQGNYLQCHLAMRRPPLSQCQWKISRRFSKKLKAEDEFPSCTRLPQLDSSNALHALAPRSSRRNSNERPNRSAEYETSDATPLPPPSISIVNGTANHRAAMILAEIEASIRKVFAFCEAPQQRALPNPSNSVTSR